MQKNAGQTALMKSAWNGHLEIAKLLAPLQAKMQDTYGQTALMISAAADRLEFAKLIIDHEAGIKSNDGRTATTIAFSRYHPPCLRLLLANEKEREASQIQRVMMAAYHGDIRYLVSNQDEWSTKRDRMAVLDFALIGCQRKAVRLLISSEEARKSFAEEFDSRSDKWGSITPSRRFLSTYASFMFDIAPAVHMMRARCKSSLLLVSLIEQIGDASHILRAVCTPDVGSMIRDLRKFRSGPHIVRVLAGLKHVGFSNDGKTVENIARELDGPVAQYLASNPLKQAQIQRAKEEAERWIPNEKQVYWREIEAESAFNGSLITGSRDAIQRASASCQLVHDSNANSIEHKQTRIDILLMSSYQFMFRVVREMLEE